VFERNVFYECSEHSGLEVAKFEDTLATLPSSTLQPAPLPSILKSINNKKNTSRRVSVGVPVYYDYFSRYNNQDVKKYMADMSHCYRHTQHLAEKEMHQVQSRAVKLRKHILHLTGRELPIHLHQPFNCCLDPATPEDLTAFIAVCQELEEELNHAATTIQCAFRVPPTASSAKLSLWKRLYQEKIKPVDEEDKIKSESKPATVVTKHRSYKPSINFKKNRAIRQTTLSSMRKAKKAANLARRRGLVAVESLPIIQAPVRALIPYAPSALKEKRDSFDTYKLSRPIKLEQVLQMYMPIQFSSILPALDLYSLIEVDEPIEITSILPKCKLLPIMEVDEPADLTSILKAAAATIIQALIRGALARSALARREETDEPRQLEQEAEAEAVDFEQVVEPLDIIPEEAASEPIQSPKKLRRCKAVESSLDGRYWSVSSTRRRRKSSRVRSQPVFFTPS
jgi:hypothetical protein